MERKERTKSNIKKAVRITAAVSLAVSAGSVAVEKNFNPTDSYDSAKHLVLEKPPQLLDKLVTEAEADGTVVVDDLVNDGWNAQFSGDGSVSFVTGPETAPMGDGSARLFTGTDGSLAASIITFNYESTDLASITALTHDSYGSVINNSLPSQPSMYIHVMTDGGPDILHFDPNAQSTGALLNEWQAWNTKDASWQASLKPFPGTLAEYITFMINAYGPNVTISDVEFQVGPAAQGNVFDGNVDNFTIGVNGSNTTYDFEPSTDTDSDGLSNSQEASLGTDPNNPDTDGDFFNDGAEVAAGTDPLDMDSDNGGANDGLEVGLATDPLSSADDAALLPLDSDGDGCTNEQEMGPNHMLGGERNPLDMWDFYDVNGDKLVDLSDTLIVLEHFGHSQEHPIDNLLDRSVPDPQKPWRTSESNDGVDLTDALTSLESFGDSCD